MFQRWHGLLVLSAALCAPSAALGQTPSAEEQGAIDWLRSASVDEVELGIQTLSVSGTAAGAAALCERLRHGLPPNLAVQAIEAVEALGQRSSVSTLVWLLRSRRSDVRARAVTALGVLGGPEAIVALRGIVDDPDPVVRVAAVHALGRVRDAGALPLLARAFDRGVYEAAEVIGALGGADEVRGLLGHVGHVPLESLLPGLGAALRRTELPQRLRLDIVAQLTDLGTQSVRIFFEEQLTHLPGSANDPVKRAIHEAIVRISG